MKLDPTPMKLDPSSKFILAIIAGGVAALTAIALERRHHRRLRHLRQMVDDLEPSNQPPTPGRLTRPLTRPLNRSARAELDHLRDRLEEGVESLRGKTAELKERVAETLEQAEDRLREGAGKLREGFQRAAAAAKDATAAPLGETRSAFEDGKL